MNQTTEFTCPKCGSPGRITLDWTPAIEVPIAPPEPKIVYSTFGPKDSFNQSGGRAVADGDNPFPSSVADSFRPLMSGRLHSVDIAINRSSVNPVAGTVRRASIHCEQPDGSVGAKLCDLKPFEPAIRQVGAAGLTSSIERILPDGPSVELDALKRYWLILWHNEKGTTKDIWFMSQTGVGRTATAKRDLTWSYYTGVPSAFRINLHA